MKIVFAGSSEFAIPALESIISSDKHSLALVISQPPRPKGRKKQLQDTPLAACAAGHSIKLFCPEDVNSPASIKRILSHKADILITASYGAFLGRSLRRGFPIKAINLHPSLLPKHRGSSPIRAALLAGESLTGNSIFRLAAKMDAGDILMQEKLEILPNENHSDLHDRLADLAARMLICYLDDPDHFKPTPQDHAQATFTKMITKDDLILDFTKSAKTLQDQIRAYSLEPGAFALFRSQPLKILEAELAQSTTDHVPGEISEIIKNRGFTVSTSDGALLIRRVQPAGKKIMDAWAYHLGARLEVGQRFAR
jgi:methionyl-tRNA formyltransferase